MASTTLSMSLKTRRNEGLLCLRHVGDGSALPHGASFQRVTRLLVRRAIETGGFEGWSQQSCDQQIRLGGEHRPGSNPNRAPSGVGC